MFIVKICAGLANQMFQYALYKSLAKNGKRVFIDKASFNPKWEFEDVNLNNVFPNIVPENADIYLVKIFHPKKMGKIDRIKRRILNAFNLPEKLRPNYIKEPKFTFNSFIFNLDGDYYLDGFWQTEKYFKLISDSIRHDFTFPPLIDLRNIELSKTLIRETSVAIHVRKGADYKKSITSGTCSLEYYKAAIELINKKNTNSSFFIFSDNIQWCMENLGFCNPTFVDWNPASGPLNYIDMQLMSLCKHNIIANSSYSWWGAWLNNNPDKIIIAPKIWFNKKYCSFDTSDIVPDNWIKL